MMRNKAFFFLLVLLLGLQAFPMAALANQEYFVLNTQKPCPSQDIKVKYYFQAETGNEYILALCKEKFPTQFSEFKSFIVGSKNLSSEMSGSYISGAWSIKAPGELGKYQLILVGPKPASNDVFTRIGCYVANAASDLGSVADPVTGISLNDVGQGVMELISHDPVASGLIDAVSSLFGDNQESAAVLLKIPVEVVQASAPTTPATSTNGTAGLVITTPVISNPVNTGLDINDLTNSGAIGPVGNAANPGSTATPGPVGNPVNIANTTNTNQNTNNTSNNANTSINISGSTVANSNIGSNNQTNQNTTNHNAITVTKYVTVTVNGQPVQSDVRPFVNADGRTMLPIRAISEALGAQVQWDSATQTATLTLGEKVVKVQIGQNSIFRQRYAGGMDTSAVIMDGRTLLPVRAVGESWGPG
jgi:hypothetical protein